MQQNVLFCTFLLCKSILYQLQQKVFNIFISFLCIFNAFLYILFFSFCTRLVYSNASYYIYTHVL